LVKRVQRFDVVLVTLDPTVGAEIRKTRPCVVVSPNDLNRALKRIIFAPMTSTVWNAPSGYQFIFAIGLAASL
jgi:mRNA interferase MazF